MKVYAFRVGSRNYPSGIRGPFPTMAEARMRAYSARCFGNETGRIRKVTKEEFEAARSALRSGVLTKGF